MRKIFFITAIILFAFSYNINAQTLGSKKNITLKLMSYECGDYCHIELQDITTKATYGVDNIDQKTKVPIKVKWWIKVLKALFASSMIIRAFSNPFT
jgi:hypothetical protein